MYVLGIKLSEFLWTVTTSETIEAGSRDWNRLMKSIEVPTKCSLQGFENVHNFSILLDSFNKMSLCCKS